MSWFARHSWPRARIQIGAPRRIITLHITASSFLRIFPRKPVCLRVLGPCIGQYALLHGLPTGLARDMRCPSLMDVHANLRVVCQEFCRGSTWLVRYGTSRLVISPPYLQGAAIWPGGPIGGLDKRGIRILSRVDEKEYHNNFQGTGILSTTRKAAAKGCRGDETQEAAVMALLLRSCFDLMAQLLDGDRALLFWPRDHGLLETAGEITPHCRVIPSEISGELV